jgi:hypothetical protein
VGSGRCGSGNPPKPNTCWDARTRSKVRSQHRAQLPHVFTTHMNHPDDVGRVRVTAERKQKGSRARAGQMAEAVYFKHFSQSTQRRSRAKSRARAARASPTSIGGSLAARGLSLEVWARTGRARAPQSVVLKDRPNRVFSHFAESSDARTQTCRNHAAGARFWLGRE